MYAVQTWLSGQRNFYVGKSIYKTLGKNQRLKDLLEKGKTPTAEELLLKAMQDLVTAPVTIPSTPLITKTTDEMPAGTDPVQQSIRAEWMAPYQQMNYKRHELDRYDTDSIEHIKARKKLAFEILELEQQCMKLWEKRDYYLKHGKLPDIAEKVIEVPTDPVELGKLIESIKKNIRRNRKLQVEHPDKPVYAEKYKEYKQKFEQLTGKPYDERE